MINVQRWEHSRDADRQPFGPEHLVEELDVRQHGVVAVIGATPERYTLPLVSRVGAGGIIYSLDSSENAIERRASETLPAQIRVRHSNRDQLPLADHSVDLALLAFVLRQIAHLRTLLTEIRRVLRPGGRIAVADWIRQEEQAGPLREERVSAATCERCLAAIGFGLIGHRVLNRSHYLIIGRRPMTD